MIQISMKALGVVPSLRRNPQRGFRLLVHSLALRLRSGHPARSFHKPLQGPLRAPITS